MKEIIYQKYFYKVDCGRICDTIESNEAAGADNKEDMLKKRLGISMVEYICGETNCIEKGHGPLYVVLA